MVPDRERMTSDCVVQPPDPVLHAAQQLAVGDAGGDEEDVTAHEVVDVQHAVEVVPGVEGLLPLVVVLRPELALQRTAHALERAGGDDPLRRATDAQEQVDAGALPGGGDRAGDVAVGDELDAGAGLADLVDELLVPGAVEDADGDVAEGALLGLGDALDVLGDRGGEAGARIKFITDGDVAGAITRAREGTGVDLLLGIGGTPEGIIAACALKCMGGALQDKGWPKDDDERQKAIDAGHDLDRVLHIDDLVRGDVFFVATGITDGELLRGVQYRSGGCTTQSLVMRSRSGTIRSIESLHSLEKLRASAPSR